jgi:FKBP-type peptidyl-prolyl cis-trans isomerase
MSSVKVLLSASFMALLMSTSCSGSKEEEEKGDAIKQEDFKNNDEKYSYCWGMNLALNRMMSFGQMNISDKINKEDLVTRFGKNLLESIEMSQELADSLFGSTFSKLRAGTELTGEEQNTFISSLAALDAYSIIQTIEHFEIEKIIDKKIFLQGYADVLQAKPLRVDEETGNQIISNYFYELQSAKSKNESETFLAENLKNDSIQKTETGLQYQIIRLGNGAKPTGTQKVKVHYRGKLLNGKVFDTSYDGEPIEFSLNQVIAGWTEGLQLMPSGSHFRFFIPGELAYGATPPQGSGIPPNAALIFDVELLEIK